MISDPRQAFVWTWLPGAGLSTVERSGFWRRQFLNPYALEDY